MAPRPTTVTATNERGQSTTTQYSCGSVYNQVTDIRNYDYGGSDVTQFYAHAVSKQQQLHQPPHLQPATRG